MYGCTWLIDVWDNIVFEIMMYAINVITMYYNLIIGIGKWHMYDILPFMNVVLYVSVLVDDCVVIY